jgi:uncharacterized membrane protein YhaH (DUF805 family)
MEWMFKPLARYAEFSGRSRRMEYWMWALFQFLIYFAVVILMMLFGGAAMLSGDPNAMMGAGFGMVVILILYVLLSLALLVPSLAVSVRRLHDTDRSGWWIVAPLAPYVVMIFAGAMLTASPDLAMVAGGLALVSMLAVLVLGVTVFIFMVLEGTRGPNKYGPDPKAEGTSEVFR